MARCFVCLVAVIDWHRRRILASRDNVFVERLWQSVKYEESCLHAYVCMTKIAGQLVTHSSTIGASSPREQDPRA